ncbi:MAG TPA: hypothetical protein VG844_06940 [Terracidiphilus sp.]|nr:hypothetical protein [Terracidiphilus sp.]
MAARFSTSRILPPAVLLTLSLLWALDSLRNDLWPGPFRAANRLPFFEHEYLRWTVLASAVVLLALVRRSKWPARRVLFHATLTGLGIFVVPVLLIHACGGIVPDLTRVALFSLTPLLALVFEPFLGAAGLSNAKGGMAAALVLVAGAFFLFPFNLPNSMTLALANGLLLIAITVIAAANCWAVRIAHTPSAPSTLAWAAICAIATAFSFGVISLISQPSVAPTIQLWPAALWVLLIDLPALLAFFWLLPRLTAARMTLRFALAPLFAALLSVIFFAPSVSLSAAAGLALMATGTGWMLFAPDGGGASSISLGLDANDSNRKFKQ